MYVYPVGTVNTAVTTPNDASVFWPDVAITEVSTVDIFSKNNY